MAEVFQANASVCELSSNIFFHLPTIFSQMNSRRMKTPHATKRSRDSLNLHIFPKISNYLICLLMLIRMIQVTLRRSSRYLAAPILPRTCTRQSPRALSLGQATHLPALLLSMPSGHVTRIGTTVRAQSDRDLTRRQWTPRASRMTQMPVQRSGWSMSTCIGRCLITNARSRVAR